MYRTTAYDAGYVALRKSWTRRWSRVIAALPQPAAITRVLSSP